MAAAGLSLTTAASFAGVRGFFQIPGRLLLRPLTRRFSTPAAIALCYAGAASAALALFVATFGVSAYLVAAYFCVLGGMSLGMLSPLNGLYQAEVFGDERLGTLSGVAVIVGSTAAALGGLMAGFLVQLTGGYEATLSTVAILYVVAVFLLIRTTRGEQTVAAEFSSTISS